MPADSVSYRIGKFIRRNRPAVITGVLVAAGLLGFTLFSRVQKREAVRQRDAAVRESERSDALLTFQRSLLTQVGERSMTMKQILDEPGSWCPA